MPNPKRRHSTQRTRKRRTHYKAVADNIAICPTTGEPHLFHRAYWHEGKMYYKGKVVIDTVTAA